MHLGLDFEKKLDGFYLRVRYEGEARRIGILGASGCGKSMTLRSIAGIERPDRGSIRLGERTLFDSGERSGKKIDLRPQQRRVGYLFQNYALFPSMTVEQNIMAGLKGPKAEKLRRAQEMMRAFQIEGLGKRRPDELSGGQQQRAALARIMAYRPEAVLLDEPFSAMDYFLKERLRLEMIQFLREYQGLSVLVTHDRDEAYQLCDYLLLMHEGQIIGQGPVKEVFSRPRTVEAARLTGCKNISRIHPVGRHLVCAESWGNIELTVAEEVSPEITHIGIRAHDLFPSCGKAFPSGAASRPEDLPPLIEPSPHGGSPNVIPVEEPVLTELPFEWYVVLRNGLWWKIPKDRHSHGFQAGIPSALSVDPSSIMLLRADQE